MSEVSSVIVVKLHQTYIQTARVLALLFATCAFGDDAATAQRHARELNQHSQSMRNIRDAISQWLAVAVPPANILFGTRYRYNEWGQMIGETSTGRWIEATTPDQGDGAGTVSSHQFVWQLRKKLDSVEHCTLEQYVTRVLADTSVEDCRDRYKRTIPDLTGLSALAVENSLTALGLKLQVLPGTLAPNALMVSKVQRQSPNAYQPFTAGSTVTVWLFDARDVGSQAMQPTDSQSQ